MSGDREPGNPGLQEEAGGVLAGSPVSLFPSPSASLIRGPAGQGWGLARPTSRAPGSDTDAVSREVTGTHGGTLQGADVAVPALRSER